MNTMMTCDPCRYWPQGSYADSRSYQAEQSKTASLSLSQSTDLTIETDEGDVVTLSMDRWLDAGYASSSSLTYGSDGSFSMSKQEQFDLSAGKEFTVEVEGDLNKEEIKDIRKAVRAIRKIMKAFLSGDMDKMTKRAGRLENLDTISGIDAEFSYERQVSVASSSSVKVEIEQPVYKAAPPEHVETQSPIDRLTQRVDEITDEMAERVKNSGARRRPLMRAIKDLFAAYRDGRVEEAPEDKTGQAVVTMIESAFVEKVETVKESASFSFSYDAA